MTSNTLAERYNSAAHGWQASIKKLGFVNQYEQFFKQAQPTDATQRHASELLEVGIGSGALALAFSQTHPKLQRVVGVDFSRNMLQQAEALLTRIGLNFEPHQVDLNQPSPLGLWTKKFDTILCAHVLEHMNAPINLLQQLKHSLKTKGRVYLVVSKPHWCHTLIHWRWKHRSFSSEQVISMANEAGLTLVSQYNFIYGPPSRMSRAYVFTKMK
jgi:2-polyprenyl-3-methyl-5-hydroxy-6-metoxy-1,4-benzoquinol methylase